MALLPFLLDFVDWRLGRVFLIEAAIIEITPKKTPTAAQYIAGRYPLTRRNTRESSRAGTPRRARTWSEGPTLLCEIY
jgi:hypothetical protein